VVHTSVVADINSLRHDVGLVNDSLHSLTSVVQAACMSQAAGHHVAPQLTAASKPYRAPAMVHPSRSTFAAATSRSCPPPSPFRIANTNQPTSSTVTSSPPGLEVDTRNGGTATQRLPSHNLVIPRLPLIRSNGRKAPKAESWKDIIQHWLVGDPARGLKTPLKDWPQGWYQGPNRKLAAQYQQRAVVALEFINK